MTAENKMFYVMAYNRKQVKQCCKIYTTLYKRTLVQTEKVTPKTTLNMTTFTATQSSYRKRRKSVYKPHAFPNARTKAGIKP